MNLITLENLKSVIETYNKDEIDIITKAYNYAYIKHDGVYRKSGEPYIYHPLRVAYTLACIKADKDTICAALLHDVVEDTDATKEDIEKEFNVNIATIVDGVTKLSRNHFITKKDQINANQRRIITSIISDPRILIVKLVDRLDNMRTLGSLSKEDQLKIARETMDIYVNLANYIGAYRIARELEDLAFRYLEPKIYSEIEIMLAEILEDGIKCLSEMKGVIKNDLLRKKGITSNIKYRIKNVYGIYKNILMSIKMSDIHDLLSLKIMVQDEDECYITLGKVHDNYNPKNSAFKDYICRPKTNMYQGLHTTVNGPYGRQVQTQIRTFNMETIAKDGLIAYWHINKGLATDAMIEDLSSKFQFFKILQDIDRNTTDNGMFMERVYKELFSKNIYIFMPNGEVIQIPEGATVNDLIRRINSKDIDNVVGAIVNGKNIDLNYNLNSNDSVKIIRKGNRIDSLGIVK